MKSSTILAAFTACILASAPVLLAKGPPAVNPGNGPNGDPEIRQTFGVLRSLEARGIELDTGSETEGPIPFTTTLNLEGLETLTRELDSLILSDKDTFAVVVMTMRETGQVQFFPGVNGVIISSYPEGLVISLRFGGEWLEVTEDVASLAMTFDTSGDIILDSGLELVGPPPGGSPSFGGSVEVQFSERSSICFCTRG